MASTSSDEDDSSEIHIQKKQRTEDKTCSAMMYLDVLHCPVCCESLTTPIFQCDDGHLACSSCCSKLSNKCHACALPIGKNRCIAMERVLESTLVRCPNAEFGCTKMVSNWKIPTHLKECSRSQCSCPALGCDYTGSYEDLYKHLFHSSSIHHVIYMFCTGFRCGEIFDVRMNIKVKDKNKIYVKREFKKHLLFAVQCFSEADGVYITVSCIAPSAPEVGEFSYHLSYTVDGNAITHESTVKRLLELSSKRPEESYMRIPHSLLRGERLVMELCINMLNKE
ncbi:PREDICTED: putative E3 ubiquitin-protein ligase SINA-like 9 [Camelina sativa]|uniref:RING-type E3 ubiquitin transferase n=1 Tax=Camelina sativa TaxID=90675 RepID=A0ABM1QHY0_CAMSA|nr:PREDICTED: putative E3 ubiquitin-protein ligase SINA-like 9 [Camelina sativa]